MYTANLDDHIGGSVQRVEADDIGHNNEKRGIDRQLWSCHTVEIPGCLVVGHVPVSVIEELLVEAPDFDGIALPDMSSGSPRMGGNKDRT